VEEGDKQNTLELLNFVGEKLMRQGGKSRMEIFQMIDTNSDGLGFRV
jgi:hypothetical protein